MKLGQSGCITESRSLCSLDYNLSPENWCAFSQMPHLPKYTEFQNLGHSLGVGRLNLLGGRGLLRLFIAFPKK